MAKKHTVKVERCGEFACPFFHAGHMGSLMCTIAWRDIKVEDQGQTPPDWCPLRDHPIKIKLR